jgi:hypothetical protein
MEGHPPVETSSEAKEVVQVFRSPSISMALHPNVLLPSKLWKKTCE